MTLQRDYSVTELMSTNAPGSVILVRLYVGLIFIIEGMLKYAQNSWGLAGSPRRASLRRLRWQISTARLKLAAVLLIVLGLVTRLAVMPMIVDMLGALATTKFPLLWGSAALYPGEHGLWDFVHESRLEWAMLCGSLFLLAVGSGRRSLDARFLGRASRKDAALL
jgi:putative oxidoreductase